MSLLVDIPDVLKQRLEEIRKRRNLSSLDQVVRDALTYYVAAVEQRDAGGNIIFEREENGVLKRVAAFI